MPDPEERAPVQELPTGGPSSSPCERRYGGRRGEVRAGSRPVTSSPTSDATKWSWISSPPRMLRGWSRSRLGKIPKARQWELRERNEARGGKRLRRASTLPPHAFLHGLCGRGGGRGVASLCLFLYYFLSALYYFRDRSGRRQMGLATCRLQTDRGRAVGQRQFVHRHDLPIKVACD